MGKFLPALADGGTLVLQSHEYQQTMQTNKPSFYLMPDIRFKVRSLVPMASRMVHCAGSEDDEDPFPQDPSLAQAEVDHFLMERDYNFFAEDFSAEDPDPNAARTQSPAGTPGPLAGCLGTDPPGKLTFTASMNQVIQNNLSLSKMERSKETMNIIAESWDQVCDLLDLPLTPDLPTGPVSQFVQLHKNLPPNFLFDVFEINKLLFNKDYNELPQPLRPSQETVVPYSMDLHYITLSNDAKAILKHIQFDQRQNASWILSTFKKDGDDDGDIYFCARDKVHWTMFAKVFQYMLERCPGIHLMGNVLGKEEGKPKESKRQEQKLPASCRPEASQEEVDKRLAGYAYVQKWGPVTNRNNEQTIWADLHCNFYKSSKVFGWQEARVKELLLNKTNGLKGAKTQVDNALFFRSVHPFLLDHIIMPILADFNQYGTWLCGESRVGKSNLSRMLGFRISEYYLKKHAGQMEVQGMVPSILTARYADFFRLEPGNIFKPAIGDDIELSKMAWADAKGMADPSDRDALLWARWGGSSFAVGQWRCFTTNPYNAAFEATLRNLFKIGLYTYIPYDAFLALMAPNFSRKDKRSDEISWSDADALMQRLHVVLFTKRLNLIK